MLLVETQKLNKKEVTVVSSLDVAETFTYFDEENNHKYIREHKAILRAIRELKCSEEFRGEHFSPSEYMDTRGKKQPCILMDKDGFSLLVMGFADPKAMKFKEAYIKQFNAMEQTLQGKLIEREKGIVVRQSFTKALQQSNENERMHGHAYSTYTDVVYKTVFGKNAKQLREEYGISKKDNLRDCFSVEELEQVQSVEMVVSGLVNCGWGYDEIKNFVLNAEKRLIAG